MTAAFEPLVYELRPAPAAVDVFRRLSALPHCIFFDSARLDSVLGRYSFVAADPAEFRTVASGSAATFAEWTALTLPYSTPRIAGLPPFQGGVAGLLSYDLGRRWEPVGECRFNEFELPDAAFGLYDVVVAFDHAERRAWIVSQGLPETESSARRRRAQQRLDEFVKLLSQPTADVALDKTRLGSPTELPVEELADQYSIAPYPGVTSNFSAAGYQAAIARAVEYVRAGDIFQVNLAQRLLCPAADDARALYLRLRTRNPAPFAGYFDLGEAQLLSASPERFLRVVDGQAEARPIKGTRPRASRPEADLFTGDELQQSEKDRAENVMIVDLLRNDLSRVCLADSVRVTELCRLERYEFVQHLVSSVVGTLRVGLSATDLLRAAFPGGSITGAPKVRAMQIIAELEPTARGVYCGSLAYLGLDGTCDSSILIRTITAARGWWQFPVGGGITAGSVPASELAETWHKAEGLLRALRP